MTETVLVPYGLEDRAAVTALLAACEEHDGVAPLSEEHLLALRLPGPDGASPDAEAILLWGVEGGPERQVVAIASRSHRSLEVAVHPAHRRRGYGTRLLRGALGLPAGEGAQEPRCAVWAHGDLPPARALATTLGLTRTRELLRMERSARPGDDGLPQLAGVVTLAEGAEVAEVDREADVGDVDREAALRQWLELNALAFADHPEQGRWTWSDLTARIAEPWFAPELLFLLPGGAVPGGDPGPDLAASLWVKPQQDPARRLAEVYVVAVHPGLAGQGLGRRLLDHVLGELSRQGWDAVELYVDGGNTAAVRLYERVGFGVVERHAQYEVPGQGAPEPAREGGQDGPSAPVLG